MATENPSAFKQTGLLAEQHAYKPFRYPWAYDFWKKQQQVHWLADEVPMADDVSDWDFRLTDEERALLTQIFRFFTQADVEVNDCYAEGTEVLTQRGFVDFRDLRDTDLVAQVNDAGETEFVQPLNHIAERRNTEMVRFFNRAGTVDVTVTPNHDMIYRRIGTKDDGATFKEKAKDLRMTQYKAFDTAALTAFVDSEGGDHLSPEERLLVAFQADGRKAENFGGERTSHYSMHFAFRKVRKADRLRDILEDCGFDYREYKSDSQWGEYINFVVRYPHGKPDFGFEWVDLSNKSAKWCRDFLEEASYWDGWRSESGAVQYRTTNPDAANVVTAIRTLAGYGGKTTFNEYDYQSAHHLVGYFEDYKPVRGQLIQKEVLPAEERMVYCVTVPSGRIIVRSNEAVLVCGNCYHRNYLRVFKPTEVVMMLSAFSNMETVHVDAYSHLLETIGMPETEYSAFLEYKEMRDKADFLRGFNPDTAEGVALTLATFGSFVEGLQLFASFAMLMNFPRQNKMKGMGQIVSWSVRDETLHMHGVNRLYHTFVQEQGDFINKAALNERILEAANQVIAQEDAFIRLAFSAGGISGLSVDEMQAYIRYIANRRLGQLGLEGGFDAPTRNPLPWMDDLINGVEHANFFEQRATEYSKGATTGDWSEIW